MYWDPLYIVAYWVGVLLLTKHLKPVYPDVTQTWYAENSWALSMFDNLERYFNSLKHTGPDRGYYPNPTKSILTVHPKKSKWGGGYLERVVCLGCTLAHVNLAVLSKMRNPKAVGSKLGKRNGRETFDPLAKQRKNILRIITPRQTVRFNRSGSFCNA